MLPHKVSLKIKEMETTATPTFLPLIVNKREERAVMEAKHINTVGSLLLPQAYGSCDRSRHHVASSHVCSDDLLTVSF